jgi:hypothetical protein
MGYIKNQYLHMLTEEHMSLNFSINRGIYGHVIEVGSSPHYISWLRVIKKYIPIYYSVCRNRRI